MQQYLTIEVSAIIRIPFDEAGKRQLQQDGRLQSEILLEAGVQELFHDDGVETISVVCDIVSPDDLFEGAAADED